MGLGSLSEGQFPRRNTCPLTAPTLQSPGQEAGPVAAEADRLAGAPNLCPAPSPSAQRFRLLGARRGGERERPSALTLPALGGGTAPLTFPHFPHPPNPPPPPPPDLPALPAPPRPASTKNPDFQTGLVVPTIPTGEESGDKACWPGDDLDGAPTGVAVGLAWVSEVPICSWRT